LVQKDPTVSAYHYHLAVALEKRGDRAAALEELKTALKSNPSKDEERKIREVMQKIDKYLNPA
jgi:thioredoxin-like negative regulator of GroEL